MFIHYIGFTATLIAFSVPVSLMRKTAACPMLTQVLSHSQAPQLFRASGPWIIFSGSLRGSSLANV